MRRSTWFAVLAAGLWVGLSAPSQAQTPLSQVLDLNRQAMTAYQSLEIEQAQELLDRALQLAQRRNVTGAPLARTYLNMGIVAVGGLGDNGRGMQMFRQALQADPSITLDPLTSTPEISTVFNLARQQAGGQQGNQQNQQNQQQNQQNQQGGGGGNLEHQAVPEQLASTAVPVYIEVPGNPAHVYLFYKAHGMREFRRVEMRSVADGYGFEIPCSDVFEPEVQYYIVAFGRDGSPVGFAGTQNDPITVPIVGTRTQPAPALPGLAPPETCHEEECPPGMEGCRSGGRPMGSSCSNDGDCGSGLHCEDDLCVAGAPAGGQSGGYLPHFFVRAGVGLAGGYVTSGMEADCPLNADPATCTPGGAEAYVLSGMEDCNLASGGDCVRVAQAGFVPNMQVRLAVGSYIPDPAAAWLGFAGYVRFAPISGAGAFSFVLLGLRLQVRPLIDLERASADGSGPSLAVWTGFSVGQVQHQPPGNGDNAPYIISGLNGIPIGLSFTYRFMKHIGAYVEAEAMFQFPTFMFNLDLSAGLEAGF
jgi:hypothetical protein